MFRRPVYMEVNLSCIKKNFQAVKKRVGKDVEVIAVIKGNAYGMGAGPIAWALREAGARFFAVATIDEALELREAGITNSILVLTVPTIADALDFVRYGITATISDLSMARALSQWGLHFRKKVPVQIKIDTGLGRSGLLPTCAKQSVAEINSMPNLSIDGIYTHFATAHRKDHQFLNEQFRIFKDVTDSMKKQGVQLGIRHCCNSSAILSAEPEKYLDAVRSGAALLGLYVSDEVDRTIDLQFSFEFKSRVTALRRHSKNSSIGYDRAFMLNKDEIVGIIPLGVADGYPCELEGRGEVLIQGQRCPVLAVCSDQTMVLVTEVQNIAVEDEVVLIGSQKKDKITYYEVTKKAGIGITNILHNISKRVQRVYVES